MPLTDEQRQKLLVLSGGGAPQQSGGQGQLPPNIANMIRTLPPKEQGKAQTRAVNTQIGQQIKADNPVPTADQRDRKKIADEAIRKIQDVRKTLSISGKQLGDRQPLTVWKQTPDGLQNPFLDPEGKQLRTQFNSAADLVAMLRTGKQGEKTQVNRVISEYNPGFFDDNATIINRLDEMEKEARAFGGSELEPDEEDIVNRLLGQ